MTSVIATLLFSLVTLVIFALSFRALSGATLLACWYWGVIAVFCVTACEVAAWAGVAADQTAERWHYLAALTSLCPTLAILGAKRPQNRAWQWIVLTGWGVLALPAAQAWLICPDQPLEVHALWAWLIGAVIAIGVFNYLPTRHWLSALLVGAGQWLLLGPPLPVAGDVSADTKAAAAMALFTVGLGWARWRANERARGASAVGNAIGDFRDWYGIVWTARIVNRVWGNEPDLPAASFTPIDPQWEAARAAAVRPLLARFVSAQWIESRLDAAEETPLSTADGAAQ